LASVYLSRLTKRYGKLEAVKNFTLKIEDGELMVLLGPTGAGKTTTLRCVAGLEYPENGDIFIGESKVNELTPADRDVAFVFQNYSLYPRYTVYGNLASPLKARRFSKSEINRVVKETAELLHITSLLERTPEHLSGGEMQRVAIGRALVRKPRVFLMDEPFTNLDANLREEMRTELKKLQGTIGATFFYATPDQAEGLSIADRIAVLREGRIQQIGSPTRIYSYPANMFVAGFLGSPGMNFINCQYLGRSILDIGPGLFKLNIPVPVGRKIEEAGINSEMVLGVRPENVSLMREKTGDFIKAEMDVMESMGSWNIVSLKIGDYYLRAKTDADFEAKKGEVIWACFDCKRIHLFDSITQRAIL